MRWWRIILENEIPTSYTEPVRYDVKYRRGLAIKLTEKEILQANFLLGELWKAWAKDESFRWDLEPMQRRVFKIVTKRI